MGLDHLPHQCQPQTDPPRDPPVTVIHPIKPLENPPQRLRRNPHAPILHTDGHHRPLLGCPQHYLAPLGGILDGIGEQVIQHLLQSLRVTLNIG